MLSVILLALAAVSEEPASAQPCVPQVPVTSQPVASAVGEHLALRSALGEEMPEAATMVLVFGRGGHLATQEHSIILARSADGIWRGTAVGRSKIWVEEAPFSPMRKEEWVLDAETSRELDQALTRPCASELKPSADLTNTGPPLRGLIYERVDVVRTGHPASTFYATQGSALVLLTRPPTQG